MHHKDTAPPARHAVIAPLDTAHFRQSARMAERWAAHLAPGHTEG